MSKTPPRSASEHGHPLQLDFFQAGMFRKEVSGWVHRKTVPYTILAQAVEGTYAVRCGGRQETLAAGRVLVVPAHVPAEFTHRNGPSGMMEARWLHLRFSLWGLADFLGRYDLPLQLPEKESIEIGRLIGRALEVDMLAENDPVRLIRHQETAARVLGVICLNQRLRGDAWLADERWERLGVVLAHIKDNLAASLSVEALARLAGMSAARFYAVFKEEFDVTPMNYVRTVRLEAAARLLVETDMKLARVAEETGFADAFHLSHAFKDHFGASPREYRRNAAIL